ncbi:MAG: plasmid pRiA4b ORF-3 family protein [Rhodovibrio sp.]|nr:plasmid pRiA4b ORF-3 family protein [Rhodovibrio sp.]
MEHYTEIARLRIELELTDPLVWRRVDVPLDLRLRRVHEVIQAVFDWTGSHLHQFEVEGRLYGRPEIMGEDLGETSLYSDRNVKLGKILERLEPGAEEFLYTYDFGDSWEHWIGVEQTFAPEAGVEYPVLVDGARRAPPEDIGGPPGFAELLDALQDENHPDREDLVEFLGPEPFDPDDMQLDKVEAMLSRIRRSRRKGPAKGSRMTTNKVWTSVR